MRAARARRAAGSEDAMERRATMPRPPRLQPGPTPYARTGNALHASSKAPHLLSGKKGSRIRQLPGNGGSDFVYIDGIVVQAAQAEDDSTWVFAHNDGDQEDLEPQGEGWRNCSKAPKGPQQGKVELAGS